MSEQRNTGMEKIEIYVHRKPTDMSSSKKSQILNLQHTHLMEM